MCHDASIRFGCLKLDRLIIQCTVWHIQACEIDAPAKAGLGPGRSPEAQGARPDPTPARRAVGRFQAPGRLARCPSPTSAGGADRRGPGPSRGASTPPSTRPKRCARPSRTRTTTPSTRRRASSRRRQRGGTCPAPARGGAHSHARRAQAPVGRWGRLFEARAGARLAHGAIGSGRGRENDAGVLRAQPLGCIGEGMGPGRARREPARGPIGRHGCGRSPETSG